MNLKFDEHLAGVLIVFSRNDMFGPEGRIALCIPANHGDF